VNPHDFDADARKVAIERLMAQLTKVGVEKHAGIRKQIARLKAGLPPEDAPPPAVPVEAAVVEEAVAEPRARAMAVDRKLLAGVQAAEALIDQRADINLQLAALFAVLKAQGYDPKTVRLVIKRRAMDPADRVAGDELLEAYECALGMVPDLEMPETADPDLARKLLGPAERKAPTLKQKHAIDAVALAQASLMYRPTKPGVPR
jgi:uncharacterized protein (UPF0335 family)